MRSPRSRLLTALLVAAVLPWAGCDTDGPAFPEGESLMFPGTLEAEERSLVHLFSLTSSGTLRIELTELVATNPETGEPIPTPLLVVALGRPDEQGVCTTTLTQLLTQSSYFPVFLEIGEYCLSTSRPVNISIETVVDYLLTIDRAFS